MKRWSWIKNYLSFDL